MEQGRQVRIEDGRVSADEEPELRRHRVRQRDVSKAGALGELPDLQFEFAVSIGVQEHDGDAFEAACVERPQFVEYRAASGLSRTSPLGAHRASTSRTAPYRTGGFRMSRSNKAGRA